MTKSFYVTTPIYYVNDAPHIGHAYTTIACDVLARFMRLDGAEVRFLTGTDEHGQKVDKAAKNAGIDPQAFTDKVSEHFKELVSGGKNTLGVSNTDFVRTTEERHKKVAQEVWKRIDQNNHIYLDKYAGWYSVRDEAFYQESELVDGKAPTGADVEWVEEESYFFDLSQWQDKLLKFYDQNPDFIVPKSRFNEVYSFVKGGLKDLSISRTTFKWGVPVNGNKDHVMYVWIDALTNYLTGIDFLNIEGKEYKNFWADEESLGPIHVVGKDILRFHAVYWPAFLMAADIPLPKRIVAHGWWTIEGEKMSKSLGNVISPDDLIEEFGLDQTRYFLIREVPFGNDGNFSRDSVRQRINSDLANNLGNLVQRTLSMIQKNCEGKVPSHQEFDKKEDEPLLISAYALSLKDEKVREQMTKQKFHSALENIMAVSSQANEYIDKQVPWKLKKEDPERMGTVLYVLAETIRCIALALQPFITASTQKILNQLSVSDDERLMKHICADFAIKSGTPLPPPEIIFPRIEEKEAAA